MLNIYSILDWHWKMSSEMEHRSKYHVETFYQHVLSAANTAAEEKANRKVFIAALLHDIGKPVTLAMKNGNATFYGHENHLENLSLFLNKKDPDFNYIEDLIRWHMLPYTMKGPDPWATSAMVKFAEVSRTHSANFIEDLLLLHKCDRKGSYREEAPSIATMKDMAEKVIQYCEVNNF